MLKRLKEYFTNDNLEYEFLPPALEIQETPPSPVRRALIWLIAVMVLATFLWAYFGEVDEVAVARGKVIPDGRVKVIQPLETGIIRAIHVKEGEKVRAGQLLIELDPTIRQADAESASKTLAMHIADRQRLMEELNGGYGSSNTKKVNGLQAKLKEARESEYKAKEESLRFVISQRQNALEANRAMLVKFEKVHSILKEQEEAYSKLYSQGYIAKMDFFDKRKGFYSAEQELEAQRKIVRQSEDSLEEAKRSLEALRREREKIILNDIVGMERNIASVEGEAIKAKKMYELERLVSPVDGAVHGLAAYTVGGVVTPAQPVVTVVPEGTALIIEAMALNKDIGFLSPGQEAEIKLDTFPFQKYGTLKGRLVSISPDAFEDEKLGAVYRVRVEMQKTTFRVNGRDIEVTPGMSVFVEIKTGKRKIIEFFLSPIVKYAKESLTLR